LFWKLNRLRAMGAAEIAYRVRQAMQAQWERRGLGRARPPAPTGECGRPWLAELPRGFDADVYRGAAERVLAGRFDIFALKDTALGFPPDWNRDPKTGRVAPLVFGKALNYRDENLVGDIKYLWEPNRHAELVTLAQAWHLTGEARYAEGCRALLDSWFEQCPYPLGPNWTSSLEHGVRLANWAVAWFLLADSPVFTGSAGESFRCRWLDAIYRHCHFIAGHFSRHSSANNHLLGELMGLFIGATVWPLWPETARWREQAAREFKAEALTQTAADGVNREQAVWYQHEVADMMLLVGLFGRANGVAFSPAYWQRLEAMLDFIAALMDAGGHVPMIGDADDARLVRFDPRPEADVYRSLLATGAVLFGRGDFKAKAGAFDDKSRWLLGDGAAERFAALETKPAEPRRAFPEGGYWILGDAFDTAREVRLVADAGPLGYLSIAAHGHADALALTLSLGGVPFLIDPGTYAYHTQKRWRDYFRGTAAHNTLRVDEMDQSVIGGNFLWTRHARARCIEWAPGPELDRWVGEHDGYRRLKDPVGHRRVIELDKKARRIRVTDVVDCKGTHGLELFWHFAEDCQVVLDGAVVVTRNENMVLKLAMPESDWRPELVRGREEPASGWVSRRFDTKQPTTVALWRGTCTGRTELVTELAWGVQDP
jgi:hypothetical protein